MDPLHTSKAGGHNLSNEGLSPSSEPGKEGSRLNEARLVERCKSGDPSGFDELIRRYERAVYTFARRLTGGNDAGAASLAQETFLRAIDTIKTVKEGSNVTLWLYKTAAKAHIDQHNRRKALREPLIDEIAELAPPRDDRLPLEWSEPSPERMNAVEKALEKLPDHHKVMCLLYYVQQISREEIADLMELPLAIVKSRLTRASAALRMLLDEAEGSSRAVKNGPARVFSAFLATKVS